MAAGRDLASLLAERTVDEFQALDLHAAGELTILANGDTTFVPDGIVATFGDRAETVHQLRLQGRFSVRDATGIAIAFSVAGWEDIRYVAVGFTDDLGKFAHIKANHTIQGDLVTMVVDINDLAFRLQDDWRARDSMSISDVRVWLKATPGSDGGTVAIYSAAVYRADGTSQISVRSTSRGRRTVELLKAYLIRKNENIADQAEALASGEGYPVTGNIVLQWPINAPIPPDVSSVSTYRYIWHSLYPAAYALIHAQTTGRGVYRSAAHEMVSSWLDASFYGVDPDQRYAWYDHGTAERLVALLLLRADLIDHPREARFVRRLEDAIHSHATLLESESFYARNQSYRFHNHAWFQDMALLAAGSVVTSVASERWIACATRRLERQIKELICDELGCAIFAENSIGYHHGIESLVRFAGELRQVADGNDVWLKLADRMASWSKLYRYADGRAPSQGDTFHIPNHLRRRATTDPQEDAQVFTRAGYAIARGQHDGRPWFFAMTATSLTSTHKHEDDLAVVLHFDGLEWLLDPSFYSHDYSDAVPAYLRSAWAHSTVVLDGPEYSIAPQNSRLDGTSSGDSFTFSGEHDAYGDFRVHREVSGRLARLDLRFTDRINRRGDATAPAFRILHLGEGVQVEFKSGSIVLAHPDSDFVLLASGGAGMRIVQGLGSTSRETSITGTSFGKYESTTSVLVPAVVERPNHWTLQAIPAPTLVNDEAV